ncbi:anaphase-promoting complex subunit 11 isoform X1 [Raphanus sativus]|uniref:Anaphase-promoting complex subunit 11 n=1 Tax=Raphanus sativus TaxID=3726 RepID=A0A6J0JP05_RAPSA|nr:anaphase-promoting complex subunit 11 isoform X1 [Raphanus sativus]XP_056843752.1 anaphase-promoting complex subunit 11 isoform X1 [Raphanus sativus]
MFLNLGFCFHKKKKCFFLDSQCYYVFTDFKKTEWHAVASWTWDAQDETCGICRMPFDGCCPDCKLPGDDCPLIWGACNHSFHLHCILKWVNSQTSQAHCPMCRREWQFKE